MAAFREEDVAAGKPVSNDVRLRQVVSKATGGEEKPKTSTAPVYTNADVQRQLLIPGVKLFSDQDDTTAEIPAALQDARFLHIPIDGQKTIKCERASIVFFLTPVLDRNRDTASQPSMDQGFEKVALPEIPLFNPASPANYCTLFQKDCAAGETIFIRKWAVPVFFP